MHTSANACMFTETSHKFRTLKWELGKRKIQRANVIVLNSPQSQASLSCLLVPLSGQVCEKIQAPPAPLQMLDITLVVPVVAGCRETRQTAMPSQCCQCYFAHRRPSPTWRNLTMPSEQRRHQTRMNSLTSGGYPWCE